MVFYVSTKEIRSMKTNYSRAMIGKDSIAKAVLNQLQRDIIIGRYQQGSRLLETELASTYNTSRGTIRTAMQDLSNEGLVEFLDSGGCIVVGIDEKIIRDTYALRGMLETQAANIILSRDDVSYLPMLEVLDQYNKRESNPDFLSDPNSYSIDIDMQFHQALMKSAGNRPILRAWCSLVPVIRTLLEINLTEDYHKPFSERFYNHHKAIIDYAVLHDKRMLDEIQEQITTGMERSIDKLGKLKHAGQYPA